MKIYQQVDDDNYVLDTDNPKHLAFYNEQNHCKHCGHELTINTSKKIGHLHLIESAHCPSCKKEYEVSNHKIQ